MGKPPFKLIYMINAMIPVEVEEPSSKAIFRSTSSQTLWKEVDLASEAREMTHIRENMLKQRIANRCNSVVVPWNFQKGDLIIWRANIGPPLPRQGKLATNWEGPYCVIDVLGKGAYKLSTLSGSEIIEFLKLSKKIYMM